MDHIVENIKNIILYNEKLKRRLIKQVSIDETIIIKAETNISIIKFVNKLLIGVTSIGVAISLFSIFPFKFIILELVVASIAKIILSVTFGTQKENKTKIRFTECYMQSANNEIKELQNKIKELEKMLECYEPIKDEKIINESSYDNVLNHENIKTLGQKTIKR